jgi:hypothetical protein
VKVDGITLHIVKYTYYISLLNLNVTLECQRKFRMVRHKNYNLNVSEDLLNF